MSFALPIAGAALGGLGGLFGTPDYSGAGNKYAGTINQIAGGFDPYINQGFLAKKGMAGLGAMNMIAPAALENRLASSYQNSPYQDQIMKNTANMMNYNAAQTGMLGSTSQDAALQNQMAGLQNQFQQQYIDRGTQQYNMGEQGLMGLGQMMGQQGYGASGTQAQLQAQAALAQMQAAMMPSAGGNMFTDALGGITGML